jgi:hypothetical protein
MSTHALIHNGRSAMNARFGITLLLGLLTWVSMAHAQDTTPPVPRTISVSGEGTVSVEPDQATVRFGVVTQAEDPETAREQNAAAASRAMNALRELGIAERQIQMETLRLQPRREYNQETRNYEERGFEAIRQVVVEVDDLSQLPTLVARVVQQGANRLDGINYDVADRDAVRNEALAEAARHARSKAQLLAETLGARVGPPREISEQSFDFPRPAFRVEAAAMAKSDAAPEPDAYAAGEIEVNATVQVTFDLLVNE